MALGFNILGWKGWCADNNLQPDVSMIPAMLRRRLNPTARAAFGVMIPLVEAFGPMPLVYVSRHGEVGRTVELLEELARHEPLSPTDFSLSVHNAIPGLFSIHQRITKNITALASASQDLAAALLEAIGLCSEQEPRVLCVFCDAPLPNLYQGHADQPHSPYAFAMVVSKGGDWQLNPMTATNEKDLAAEPHALLLLRLLERGGNRLLLNAKENCWQVLRCAS